MGSARPRRGAQALLVLGALLVLAAPARAVVPGSNGLLAIGVCGARGDVRLRRGVPLRLRTAARHAVTVALPAGARVREVRMRALRAGVPGGFARARRY
jgi:hypothetical protein